eukprot:Skav233133  [mRNA]  locus=scaffold792:186154:193634:+ [translate_table: standard]
MQRSPQEIAQGANRSRPWSADVPKALGTDVGMKRKLDQVSGGVILPSAKAISTGNAAGKGAAKGGSTTAQPEIGKGRRLTTENHVVLTPKAKPAPAEARETTPTGGATGGKGPAKFQPAPKSKLFQPPEPATEPPNGKGSKGAAKGAAKGKEATPVQKAVVSPQKGTQKGGQKGAEPKGKAVQVHCIATEPTFFGNYAPPDDLDGQIIDLVGESLATEDWSTLEISLTFREASKLCVF